MQLDFLRFITVNERNYRQLSNILEIFKKFEWLQDFKVQIFQTILDDSLCLKSDFNGNESLSVDYITLNLRNGKDNIRKIAQYFNHYHRFNCYSCDQKIGFKSKKPYLDLVDPIYKLEMVVVFNANPVNGKTVLLQFSGLHSSHFYRILKTEEFNWEIFD